MDTGRTTPARYAQLTRIAIIDLEASSLGSAGFPTEIGWASVNDDGSITSGAVLIRPAARRLTYRVHGAPSPSA
jgi:hypothetical protein